MINENGGDGKGEIDSRTLLKSRLEFIAKLIAPAIAIVTIGLGPLVTDKLGKTHSGLVLGALFLLLVTFGFHYLLVPLSPGHPRTPPPGSLRSWLRAHSYLAWWIQVGLLLFLAIRLVHLWRVLQPLDARMDEIRLSLENRDFEMLESKLTAKPDAGGMSVYREWPWKLALEAQLHHAILSGFQGDAAGGGLLLRSSTLASRRIPRLAALHEFATGILEYRYGRWESARLPLSGLALDRKRLDLLPPALQLTAFSDYYAVLLTLGQKLQQPSEFWKQVDALAQQNQQLRSRARLLQAYEYYMRKDPGDLQRAVVLLSNVGNLPDWYQGKRCELLGLCLDGLGGPGSQPRSHRFYADAKSFYENAGDTLTALLSQLHRVERLARKDASAALNELAQVKNCRWREKEEELRACDADTHPLVVVHCYLTRLAIDLEGVSQINAAIASGGMSFSDGLSKLRDLSSDVMPLLVAAEQRCLEQLGSFYLLKLNLLEAKLRPRLAPDSCQEHRNAETACHEVMTGATKAGSAYFIEQARAALGEVERGLASLRCTNP